MQSDEVIFTLDICKNFWSSLLDFSDIYVKPYTLRLSTAQKSRKPVVNLTIISSWQFLKVELHYINLHWLIITSHQLLHVRGQPSFSSNLPSRAFLSSSVGIKMLLLGQMQQHRHLLIWWPSVSPCEWMVVSKIPALNCWLLFLKYHQDFSLQPQAMVKNPSTNKELAVNLRHLTTLFANWQLQ